MSFRLAHLSDLHLGPMPRVNPRALLNQRVLGYVSWQRRRYRVHRREVLDALVADLREQAPDHVAITGDLVNISLPAEFVQAAVWLRQLGTPDWVTVIPGNHDAYVEVKWREAWAHWSDYMCGDGADRAQGRGRYLPVPAPPRRDRPHRHVDRRGDAAHLRHRPPRPPADRRAEQMLDRWATTVRAGFCCCIIRRWRRMTDYRRRLVDGDELEAVLRPGRSSWSCAATSTSSSWARCRRPRRRSRWWAHPRPRCMAATAIMRAAISSMIWCPVAGGWAIDLELRRFDLATGGFARVFKRRLQTSSGPAAVRLQAAGPSRDRVAIGP